DEPPERGRDFVFRRGVDQELGYVFGKIVTGGAVNRPVTRQRFTTAKNLFHDHVNRTAILWRRNVQGFRAAALQFFEIFARQIKTIGVVDPQPGDRAGADKLEKQ